MVVCNDGPMPYLPKHEALKMHAQVLMDSDYQTPDSPPTAKATWQGESSEECKRAGRAASRGNHTKKKFITVTCGLFLQFSFVTYCI